MVLNHSAPVFALGLFMKTHSVGEKKGDNVTCQAMNKIIHFD